MYANNIFDDLIKSGVGIDNQCIVLTLRSYYEQRRDSRLNPFNILLVNELELKEHEVNDYLNFLYKSGVKEFILGDASTGLLRNLSELIMSSSFNVTVSKSFKWVNRWGSNSYGLLVEITKKRGKSVVN